MLGLGFRLERTKALNMACIGFLFLLSAPDFVHLSASLVARSLAHLRLSAFVLDSSNLDSLLFLQSLLQLTSTLSLM